MYRKTSQNEQLLDDKCKTPSGIIPVTHIFKLNSE